MERATIESSNLAAVGYDAGRQVMEVEFKNGGVFTYHGVTPDLYADFQTAKSKGAFFHSRIRSVCACTKEDPHAAR